MTEWQDAARAEAQCARILDSCLWAQGVKSSCRLDPVPITSNVTAPPPMPPVDGVVLMDVDTISMSRPRNLPLSDAERDHCMHKRCCFRCKQQGHLSLSCPSRLSPPHAHVNTIVAPSSPTASPLVTTVVRDILGLSSTERQQVINSLLLADCDLDPSTPTAQINTLALSFPSSLPHPAPSCPPSPVPCSLSPIRSPAHVAPLGFTPVDEAPRSPVTSPPHTPSPAPACTSPPPRPPRSPLRSSSPHIAPPSVVEDDNQPNRGVKTVEPSVITPKIIARTLSPTKITYYPPLFLSCACKNPRDPDEVRPSAPVTRTQNELQHTSHPVPLNTPQQDSPRPPDVDRITHHNMVRTHRRHPTPRQIPTRTNSRDPTMDLTTPHMLRRRPRVRLSES
ncbi:hypothetical protein EDB92DRAFT_1820648 [Lactarius akahatsu]|uniref:CCHC-type domain-containing protein n=1 Tax=Lactarius akahatsu TaxID=416441 RepID=A0AAD4Q883_9AGAM|nr:hypothetical protein EDB92DRAFT_1820648 [Lactarius akahatsu]